MKSLHNSPIGDFTRGGQVTIHFLRMIGQVFQKFGLATMMLYSLITLGIWMSHTTEHERYLGVRYVASITGEWLENGPEVVDIRLENGAVIQTTISTLAHSVKMKQNFWHLVQMWFKSMLQSAVGSGVLIFFLLIWLFKFGKSQREEKHLRGGKLVTGEELNAEIKKRDAGGDMHFGGIKMLKGFETTHIIMPGSSGTGKTTGIHQLLTQIRARGDRAVIFSPSGDFLSWFYREGKDTVMNIFDARTPRWDLWGECDQPYLYPMIGASLIPKPTQGETIWAEAGQTMVSVLLERMKERGQTSWKELSKLVSTVSLQELHDYVQGTKAASYFTPENEKMGSSIRTTASIAMRSIDYMRDSGQGFTFKDWVNGPDDGSWVFLNANASQLDASRPVLSTMIEVFVNRVLSLPESRTRRIWLVIDELAALNKVASIAPFVEQGRKFGGCGLFAFQQFTQLQMIYGKEMASSIIGQCNTWICFRQNDPETADLVSKKFGKVEIEENQQGLSYGANDMRDGVSLNMQRKDREVVMASEIMTMPDLTGLIKLAGDLPGGRFALTRGTIKTIAQAFVPMQEDPLQKILAIDPSQLIDLSGSEDPTVGLPSVVDDGSPLPPEGDLDGAPDPAVGVEDEAPRPRRRSVV